MTKQEFIELLKDVPDEAEIKCSCYDSGANRRLVLPFSEKDVYVNKEQTAIEIVL